LQQLLKAATVRDVASLGKRSSAERLNLRGRGANLRLVTACGNNVRASLRQSLRKGKSDTTGAADHNGGLVCEIEKRMAH
jgi:hypothetical protein